MMCSSTPWDVTVYTAIMLNKWLMFQPLSPFSAKEVLASGLELATHVPRGAAVVTKKIKSTKNNTFNEIIINDRERWIFFSDTITRGK